MQLVNETRPQVRRDRLLRLPDVESLTGLKKTTLYSLMARQAFPRSIRVSARTVVWPESAVLQWVQDQVVKACAPADVAPAEGQP